jgi:mannose-6-phosphate isomerase-like protein (cupin superfamily)
MSELASKAFVVAEDEGTATSVVGARMVTKAAGLDTDQRFDLLDQRVPAGYAPPRHRHEREDEAWYLLEGEATFWCGSQVLEAETGGFVFLPRGVEHTFKVGSRGARLLTLAVPSGFASFVAEAGEPVGLNSYPDTGPIDEQRLAEIAARHGIIITGPPPR